MIRKVKILIPLIFFFFSAAYGTLEKEIDGLMNCTSTDEYWAFMNDVVPPVVAVFKDGPDDLKDKIKDEVYHFVEDQCPGDGKEFSYGARLVTYRKPQ